MHIFLLINGKNIPLHLKFKVFQLFNVFNFHCILKLRSAWLKIAIFFSIEHFLNFNVCESRLKFEKCGQKTVIYLYLIKRKETNIIFHFFIQCVVISLNVFRRISLPHMLLKTTEFGRLRHLVLKIVFNLELIIFTSSTRVKLSTVVLLLLTMRVPSR